MRKFADKDKKVLWASASAIDAAVVAYTNLHGRPDYQINVVTEALRYYAENVGRKNPSKKNAKK